MNNGYIQVYTGNGKGKTTCMLGLTLRACGAGKSIYIIQFMKNGNYSEIKAIKKYLPQVVIEQYGSDKFITKETKSAQDIKLAQDGYAKALELVSNGSNDIVILDEVNVAVQTGLISEDELLTLMDAKAVGTELILTGRYATEKVIKHADLVTEMTEVKHYFRRGVDARVGIEM